MRTAPTNWDVLFSAPHRVEYKLNIDGVDYAGENLQGNPVISKPLLDKPAIGRVCSATMKAVIRPIDGVTIPKAARTYCYCRLVSQDGNTVTEWVKQGCFYVSSRSGKTNITLNMRDDMVKAGQTYFDKAALYDWPKQQDLVVADIARIMGVEIDNRTILSTGSSYRVNYLASDTLISEVLSYIAASNGGNWMMTEEGRLRLVPLESPKAEGSADTALGMAHNGYTDTGVAITISRVTMTSDNDETYTAGDDTGYEIAFDNPLTDQTVVDDVYKKLSGVKYIPYRVNSARINPLVELADTVAITKKDGSVVCVWLAAMDVSCNIGYTCTLEAQAEQDVEEEFPYKTASELRESRSVRTNKSYFGTSLNKAEGLVIRRIKNNAEEARVTFNADEMAFYQGNTPVLYFDAVEQTWRMSASVEIEVTDSDGETTTLSVLANGLSSEVVDLQKGFSSLQQSADEMSVQIQDVSGQYIEIKATVDGFTVTDENGKTLINGGSITTDNLFLSRLFSQNSTNSYVEMLENGLNFILNNSTSIGIGYYSADRTQPYMIFGAGATPNTDTAGMIKKYADGIWIGDSADRNTEEITKGTGIFIDTTTQTIYKYVKGFGVALADTSNVVAVFG